MMQKTTTELLRGAGVLPSDGAETKRRHGDDEYPRLGLKVFIVGSCFLSGVIEMFAKAGCRRAESIEDADLLCFTGGEDVDPRLYGEEPIKGTYFSVTRDERECDIFAKAVELSKPMFGICRGMQFLHVMNGGKLYQDVDRHGFAHPLTLLDGTRTTWFASSMHHQMCIDNATTFPLAFAPGHSKRYESYDAESKTTRTFSTDTNLDLEAAAYPNIRAIAVQGHPEVGGYPEFTIWALNELKYFLDNDCKVGSGANGVAPKPISDVPFINTGVSG